MGEGNKPGSGNKPGGRISVIQVLASALAAVTATVALSYLGVAGTIMGAALASVITVVGNFVYSRSLDRTHKAVKSLAQQAATVVLPLSRGDDDADQAPPAASSGDNAEQNADQNADADDADRPVSSPAAAAGPDEQPPDEAGESAEGTASANEEAPSGETGGPADQPEDGLSKLDNASWLKEMIRRHGPVKALVALGLAVFLVIIAIVTAVELALGKPISDELTGHDSGRKTTFVDRAAEPSAPSAPASNKAPAKSSPTPSSPAPSPSPSATPSPSPSASPEVVPSGEPSASVDPSPSGEPSPEPSPSDGAAPATASPDPENPDETKEEALPESPSPKR
ncbi:MAG: hypothetical protein LBS27_03945 [Bifidobacteriaceae bacterium]|nr:hypothetical protein [Bifidobacteriaceae bacterium]